MSNILFKIDQFNQSDLSKMFSYVESIKGEILGPTISLCHQCHHHIPAYTYHVQDQLWMIKKCRLHGMSMHMIERNYSFYKNLSYDTKAFSFTKRNIITEVTDRCNADCPHCYHMPDNSSMDIPLEDIIKRIESWNLDDIDINFAGAEPTLRKDFPELLRRVKERWPNYQLGALTNGIRLADKDWLQEIQEAGITALIIGLNHPSYLNNPILRRKQLSAIDNCYELGMMDYSIGYTMASIEELHFILDEICNRPWTPVHFRIRYGSDIGRYPNQERMYVSDTYAAIKSWCEKAGVPFEDMTGDNNLYHTMVKVNGKSVRVIQWCDETDINLEELRTGPYCDFVSDGITNFLHQIIRRDISKNQKIILPDTPPARYLIENRFDKSPLEFNNIV
jgi:uncharacterized Fe-S cluster-containing radical SAM superfamily protein